MSIGPMGIVGSLAGGQVQQAKGSDTDRVQQDTAAQSRETKNTEKAEQAIGRTSEDAQTSDRDADGRRLWDPEEEPGKQEAEVEAEVDDGQASSGQPPKAKDPDGNCGTKLDLSG